MEFDKPPGLLRQPVNFAVRVDPGSHRLRHPVLKPVSKEVDGRSSPVLSKIHPELLNGFRPPVVGVLTGVRGELGYADPYVQEDSTRL